MASMKEQCKIQEAMMRREQQQASAAPAGRSIAQMKADPALQAALRRRLDVLAGLPANRVCADCGEGGTQKAKYASVKLGVFLCNPCYAIHRNVGAHVTRVKVIMQPWSV
jgi:hypothetical protein